MMKKQQDRERINQIIDEMTLFDDDLMRKVFDKNIPATELLLHIILERDDIHVLSVVGQRELENPIAGGRNLRLDIVAEDEQSHQYDIEVQRKKDGADPRRLRFHSAMLDSRMLKAKQKFQELRDSYVIFLTEKDYYNQGLPLYPVERYIANLKQPFNDGSHIIYVNGAYQGDNKVGKLMHDFHCMAASDMNYPELAAAVQHFKEGKGRADMCEAVEKYGQELAEEAARQGRKEGIKEGRKEGKQALLQKQVAKKIKKGKNLNQIAEELEVTVEEVKAVI